MFIRGWLFDCVCYIHNAMFLLITPKIKFIQFWELNECKQIDKRLIQENLKVLKVYLNDKFIYLFSFNLKRFTNINEFLLKNTFEKSLCMCQKICVHTNTTVVAFFCCICLFNFCYSIMGAVATFYAWVFPQPIQYIQYK